MAGRRWRLIREASAADVTAPVGPVGPVRSAVEVRLAEIQAGRIGSTVTVAGLPVTIACRSLISDVVAQLPLAATRDGAPIATPAVLRRPDPFEPRRTTLEKLTASLTGYDGAYLQVLRLGADGWPMAVRALAPWAVAPLTDGGQITGWNYGGSELPASNVAYCPAYLWLDPAPHQWSDVTWAGRSPLQLAQAAFDDLAALWGYASGYYRDGGVPPYAVTHPGTLNAKQSRDFLDQWILARLERRPAILTGGIGLEAYSVPSAADALLLDGLAYLDAQVANAFRVPPSLVNVAAHASLTYSTTRDELARWLTLDLGPAYLSRLEALFTDLLPYGQTAVFDTGTFLEGRPPVEAGAPTTVPTTTPTLPAPEVMADA